MKEFKSEQKLQKLFTAARAEVGPTPKPNFPFKVMGALRRDARPEPASLFDQLGLLFPRLGLAAVLLTAAFIAADSWHSSLFATDLTSGVAEVSDQWLFATKGF
jgi:hypothetical protein